MGLAAVLPADRLVGSQQFAEAAQRDRQALLGEVAVRVRPERIRDLTFHHRPSAERDECFEQIERPALRATREFDGAVEDFDFESAEGVDADLPRRCLERLQVRVGCETMYLDELARVLALDAALQRERLPAVPRTAATQQA